MVVCKFFQQGSCWYGRDCRFDHVYSDKFSYHQPRQVQKPQQETNPKVVTDEQLVTQVVSDIQAVLQGKQWPLSVYAPYKDKANFPGFIDLSFEESRLLFYEARAGNNVEQAVMYINNLTREMYQKYQQLSQPSPNLVKILRSIYNGEPVSSPFAQNTTFGNSNNNAASVFGQQKQTFPNSNQSIFSPQNNVFNQTNQTAKSIFAQANQEIFSGQNVFKQAEPASVFSAATQSIFGLPNAQTQASPFGVSPNMNQQASPFGVSSNSSSANPFGVNVNEQASPFSANPNPSPFGVSTTQVPQGSIFAQPNKDPQSNPFVKNNQPLGNQGSVFSQNNFGLAVDEESVYRKLEDISETDLNMYKSDDFKLGFVPELAPPKALCC